MGVRRFIATVEQGWKLVNTDTNTEAHRRDADEPSSVCRQGDNTRTRLDQSDLAVSIPTRSPLCIREGGHYGNTMAAVHVRT